MALSCHLEMMWVPTAPCCNHRSKPRNAFPSFILLNSAPLALPASGFTQQPKLKGWFHSGGFTPLTLMKPLPSTRNAWPVWPPTVRPPPSHFTSFLSLTRSTPLRSLNASSGKWASNPAGSFGCSVTFLAASMAHFSNASCTPLRWVAIFSLIAFTLASAACRLAIFSRLITLTMGGALPLRVCLPLSALLLKKA